MTNGWLIGHPLPPRLPPGLRLPAECVRCLRLRARPDCLGRGYERGRNSVEGERRGRASSLPGSPGGSSGCCCCSSWQCEWCRTCWGKPRDSRSSACMLAGWSRAGAVLHATPLHATPAEGHAFSPPTRAPLLPPCRCPAAEGRCGPCLCPHQEPAREEGRRQVQLSAGALLASYARLAAAAVGGTEARRGGGRGGSTSARRLPPAGPAGAPRARLLCNDP